MAIGFGNLLVTFLMMSTVILIHVSCQRLLALRLGYKPEFIMWMYGLLGGLILCFLTNGAVVIPFVGATELHMMIKHRLGHFRYQINMVNLGLVSFMGPLGNLLFAYFLKILNIFLELPILRRFIMLNLLIAVWTMLPLPPMNDGFRIFFWSRLSYAFLFAVVAGAALLIWLTDNLLFIFVGSLLIGGIVWFLYYILYEEEAWSA
jgi:hypothetical protein